MAYQGAYGPPPGWAGQNAPFPQSAKPGANAASGGPNQIDSNAPGATVPQSSLQPLDPRTASYLTSHLNPFGYGGSSGGAPAWSNYYQGLSDTLANQMAASGQSQAALSRSQGGQLLGMGQSYGEAAGIANQGLGSSLGGTAGGRSSATFDQSGMALGSNNDAIAQLGAAASGAVPSAAEIQQKQGISDAIKAQMSAAASARGGAYAQAAAQQQGAQQAGQLEAQGVGQAAALRANEQATARQAYAGATAQQLGTLEQTGLSYQQLQAQNELQAQEQAQQGQLQGAQLGQQGFLSQEALAAQQQQGYDTLAAQTRQAYEGMAANVNQEQLQANLGYNAQALGIAEQNAQLQANQTAALIGGGTQLAGAGLAAAAMFSDENVKTDVDPQGGADPGSGLPSPQAGGGSQYDNNSLMRQGVSEKPKGGMSKDAILSALGQIRGAAQTMGSPAQAATPNVPTVQLSPTPAAPPIGGSLQRPQIAQPIAPPQPGLAMSDERAKTNVSPAPVADALLATLDKSKSTFAYKNPADQPLSPAHPKLPGARFAGVMAQDLERVPEVGRQLVTNTPRGKQIEQQAGLSAALMAIGRLHERVRSLEGRR